MRTLTRVLRWLRGPWVAPDPAPDLSWLDRKDGLDTRRPVTMHVGRCGPYAPPSPTRYDAEWPDVLAAEEPGGDLALTDTQVLGRDRYAQCDETCTADCGACKGRRFGPYAIPHPTRYDAEWPDVRAAEARPKWADLFGIDPEFPGGDLAAMAAPLPGMARDDLGTYAEPVKPRGRHRQTDPLDLILADLRGLDGL